MHTIAMCKVYAVVAIVVILRFVLPVPVHAVVVHVVRQLITAVVHLLHVIMIMVQVVVLMTIIVLLPALVLLAAIQQVAAHALAAAILQVVVEVLPVQVVAEAVLPVEAVEEDKQIRECNNSFELERTLIMNKKLLNLFPLHSEVLRRTWVILHYFPMAFCWAKR